MKRQWIGLCLFALAAVPLAIADDRADLQAASEVVWKEGEHYERLPATDSASGQQAKPEVVEFFWYGCPHCYHLEGPLAEWLRRKPADVHFRKVPVGYRPQSRAHAHLFYTLAALGRSDLDDEVFDTIHVQKNKLVDPDEARTRELQRAFAVAHGIDGAAFDRAYDSADVKAKVDAATDLAKQRRVEGVPTIVVNGIYKT
ncbi:MAG TPA: thiol:disulfide interchange protein DsbA/DsbL, partial [Steroidobacteraceae bacterium]